ncbi:HOG (high osmolarity glycerol) pathway protein [Saitoella coloradoensis]
MEAEEAESQQHVKRISLDPSAVLKAQSQQSIIRDYAYNPTDPLFHGPSSSSSSLDQTHSLSLDLEQIRLDGPPYDEDADLASPQLQGHGFAFQASHEDEEVHGRAIALFDFMPEHENEVALREGQLVWVSYRHGQGWLVAEDPATGESGLIPEDYVQLIGDFTGEELGVLHSQLSHSSHLQHDPPEEEAESSLEEDEWIDEPDDKDPQRALSPALPESQATSPTPSQQLRTPVSRRTSQMGGGGHDD